MVEKIGVILRKQLVSMLEDRTVEIAEIEKCVDEFQAYFTRFLNDLVDSSVLLK